MYKNLLTFTSSSIAKQYNGAAGLKGRFHFEEPHHIIKAVAQSSNNDHKLGSNLNNTYYQLILNGDAEKSKPLLDLKDMYQEQATQELIAAIELAKNYRVTKQGLKDLNNGSLDASKMLTIKIISIIQEEKRRLGKDIHRLGKLDLLEAAYKPH